MKVWRWLTTPVHGTGQHVRHVDDVGHDVAQNAKAGVLLLEAPREQAQGIAAVHGEEAAAIVGQPPSRPSWIRPCRC